ncbi:M4 family metallopeptidase [Bacillus wiedmannii]|uniref:M4 family metallopeptidase n=1 Tax=Bacillus wiedmannii TaxID=1890302 RepID=UPI0021D0B378|nr:M4 family metallopeptidase [Bacillus wiedmannii]MCU5684723.1 M4 family metallopeptidase [Bacillus wiedmannii]
MHNHKEGIIPTYILKELAKKGNENAKKSLEQKKEDEHEKFIESINKQDDDEKPQSAIRDTKPDRHVYDCEHTKQTRRKLVRDEGDSPTNDDDVNRAYDYSGYTLSYFKNLLHRNSIDDEGMDLIFNVNYGNNHLNASWNPRSLQMIFGDGDGKDILSFTRGIDVVAHEMAHGVTQFINNLEYAEQSGALNEHFSDVIGSAVKQHVNQQTADIADWLIGDKIIGPEYNGIALRSMKAPGTAFDNDPQPAHMRDYVQLPVTEDGDYGGVHINSGIPNKAFFLVSIEIGTDNAAVIWYNAWNDKAYLHSNSTFKDAFEAILKSTQALINQGKLASNAKNVVEKAFKEVGITSLVSI